MRAMSRRVPVGLLAALCLLFMGFQANALELGRVPAPVELPSLPASAAASGVVENEVPQVRARLLVGTTEGERRDFRR